MPAVWQQFMKYDGMKYFIIAGEASGDLHGGNLVKGLKKVDKEAQIRCRGGEYMEKAGAVLLTHYSRTAFMGFREVVTNLGKIWRDMVECRRQIDEFAPDVLILIDYPGFNLRMAAYARKRGIRVYYYILPKIWAWKENRINRIKRDVDRMYSILPFEVDFFKSHGFTVQYFGNPLADEIEKIRPAFSDKRAIYTELGLDDKPVLGLLPGSRVHEVKRILPVMLSVIDYYPAYQFVIAAVPNIPNAVYHNIVGARPVKLVCNKTYELLAVSEVALVKSGTSTLEAALIGTPQIVCYKGDWISYFIARMLLKIRFISLVNLLADREVVKELIQGEFNAHNIIKELNLLVQGGWKRDIMKKGYDDIGQLVGRSGVSDRVAADMYESLKLSGE